MKILMCQILDEITHFTKYNPTDNTSLFGSVWSLIYEVVCPLCSERQLQTFESNHNYQQSSSIATALTHLSFDIKEDALISVYCSNALLCTYTA